MLLLMKLRTVIALIAVFTFFSITAPNFLTVGTLLIVGKHVAINAYLAIGMTFVILTAGIDLSVGSIVGLTGIVAGLLLDQGLRVAPLHLTIYPNVFETILITLCVGAFVGVLNGLLITNSTSRRSSPRSGRCISRAARRCSSPTAKRFRTSSGAPNSATPASPLG